MLDILSKAAIAGNRRHKTPGSRRPQTPFFCDQANFRRVSKKYKTLQRNTWNASVLASSRPGSPCQELNNDEIKHHEQKDQNIGSLYRREILYTYALSRYPERITCRFRGTRETTRNEYLAGLLPFSELGSHKRNCPSAIKRLEIRRLRPDIACREDSPRQATGRRAG